MTNALEVYSLRKCTVFQKERKKFKSTEWEINHRKVLLTFTVVAKKLCAVLWSVVNPSFTFPKTKLPLSLCFDTEDLLVHSDGSF